MFKYAQSHVNAKFSDGIIGLLPELPIIFTAGLNAENATFTLFITDVKVNGYIQIYLDFFRGANAKRISNLH
jgi:hypothetical protein